jgi:hypothetical protein
MAVDERERFELRRRLEEVLGEGPAGTLMASLPVVEWSQLATRRDIEDLRDDLLARIDTQGRELRAEMATLRAELIGALADQRAAWVEAVGDLRSEMVFQMSHNLRVMVVAMLATVLTTVGIVVGAAGFAA